jgi:hypothetical protein
MQKEENPILKPPNIPNPSLLNLPKKPISQLIRITLEIRDKNEMPNP